MAEQRESKLAPYIGAQGSPAAPDGLQQTTDRIAAQEQAYDSGQSKLAPWVPQDSLLETAKYWYAGANSQGTRNGWDSTFYRNAFSQYDQWQQKATESGRGSTFYGWLDPNVNKSATGVQTWGADPTDEGAKARGEKRFGDVYNDGKLVGNLYEDYDQATADVLVGEFLFSGDEKARMFKDPDRQAVYRNEVERVRKENTDRFLYAPTAEQYQANVEQTQKNMDEGLGNEATILGSALASGAAGAGAGAVLGSILPGVGTAIGGFVGGIIGGTAGAVGGYLNQDQLTEMASRAQVKADIANQTYSDDWLKRTTMQVGEYSMLGQKFLSPMSNIVQGVNDEVVGDLESGFYAVDATTGQRKAGVVARGMDIGATIVDGVLKFASPTGIWMDRITLAGVVAGGVGELSTGAVWNDSRGQFDRLEGWQEKVAAVADVGIDAVQMGTVGAFAKASQSSRQMFTGTKGVNAQSVGGTGIFARSSDPSDWVDRKIDGIFGKVLGKEVGETAVTTAGVRYQLDAAGNVLSSRITTQMLAPSEFLRWIPAGYQARKLAKIDGGEMTADHLLRASTDLMGNSRFRDAVLMGYAEGGEEFVQAWIEPMATGDRASWGQAWEAYLYGAAGGAGMALGPMGHKANTKQQLQAQAYVQHAIRTGTRPTDTEWAEITKGWSDKDFEKVARGDELSNRTALQVLEAISDQQRQETAYHSPVGLAKLEAVSLSTWEAMKKKALEEGNGSLVLLGNPGEFIIAPNGRVEKNRFAANTGVMSARGAVTQIGLIAEGHHAQLNSAREDLANAQARAKTATPEQQAQIADLIASAQARVDDLTPQVKVSDMVADLILNEYRAFADERDPALWEPRLDALNELINMAASGKLVVDGNLLAPDVQRMARKAVEMKFARHPMQDRGGWTVLIPQAGTELTRLNAHGTVYIQQGMLKALGGDHDGDTLVPQHHIYHGDDDLGRMRRGDQYLEPKEGEDGRVTIEVVADAPDGEWAFLESFRTAMLTAPSTSATSVLYRLYALEKSIKAEYSSATGGPIDPTTLDRLIQEFKVSVQQGREDSRKNLVEGMVNANYEGFVAHENSQGVPNVQWLWGEISAAWDGLQKDLAYQRSVSPTSVTIEPNREAQETTNFDEIARVDAGSASATLGMLASDPVRSAQYLHYSALYRSLTQVAESETMTTDQQLALTELFGQLGDGQTATDMELVTGRNAIEERVYYWLQMMANSVKDTTKTTPEVLMLLANVRVPDAELVVGTTNTYDFNPGNITMLQLLLRRSLDIEEAKHFAAPEDSDVKKKIRKLRRYTERDPDPGKHSTTPSQALVEVFGARPLHELIGKASAYISPQMTLNQMIGQMRGLKQTPRSDEIERLKRTGAYIKDKDREFKDPPWPASVLSDSEDIQITAFAMLVDAVKVAADTYVPNMKQRDKTIHEGVVRGFQDLQTVLSAYRQLHARELGTVTTQDDRIRVLRHAMANDPNLVNDIVLLIPDAAALGVFELRPDNSVTASSWLMNVLTEENVELAAAQYYFNVKVAEFIQRSGTMDLAAVMENIDGETTPVEIQDVRGKIDPTSLTSRFHQVMYHLGSQPDGIELMRFLQTMNNATSVPDMFDRLNSESVWRNEQAELLPYHDDVALFEIAPEDSWSGQMDGSIVRENLRTWASRMQVRGAVAVEALASYENNKAVLHGMDQWRKTKSGPDPKDLNGGSTFYDLLDKALEKVKIFPDYQGQAVRDQLVELQQVGLPQTQNKGKADDKAAPFGEASITLDSYGYADPLRQEMNALTAESIEAVMSNLTMLAKDPVRLMFDDGSTFVFDITSVDKALDMLMDPMTQGLAMAILFPTVRDVNDYNILQTYLDTDARGGYKGEGNLAQMLREVNDTHLFDEMTEHAARLKQAHRYIGRIEGYVRNANHQNPNGNKGGEQFYPLQQMIHDFIAAYMHSKDATEDARTVRERLFIDIADAIKTVAAVHELQRGSLQDTLVALMQDKYGEDPAALKQMLSQGSAEKAFVDLQLVAQQAQVRQEVLDEFDVREAAATTQAERDQIMRERKDFLTEDARLHGTLGRPNTTFNNATSALSMFQQATNGQPTSFAKAEIIAYLGKQNRIHAIHRKSKLKTSDGTKINGLKLYDKAVRLIYNDPLQTLQAQVTPQEWEVLASWAADSYMADLTTRGSSSVPRSGSWLGEDGDAVRRYNDRSFAYLLDTLFDDKVLEAADLLSQNGTHYGRKTAKQATEVLMNGLLSERHLGTWTPIVVDESMKARMVLKNSPVGAAVAQEGDDPKELADFVGAGKVTWQRPKPEHFNVVALQGATDQRISDLLSSPLARTSLENHFVTSIIVQSTDPANQLTADLADALDKVTHVNHTSAETVAAGQITAVQGQTPSMGGALRVLDLAELDAHIENLKAKGELIGDYTVEIKYVDINKKPFTREWANNIFFDGAGREAVGGSGMGAIASLFFGLGALNKIGQQNPLDMATKAGMGFRAWLRAKLSTAQNLEDPTLTVAEVLANKAVHLLAQEYPMGKLMRADLPSLFKLMKMRHVIVGKDAAGEKMVVWPEQMIEWQTTGATIPMQPDWQLVPLSESVAQTLWGKSGVKGTPGALVEPTFNIQDLDIFPDLSNQRLKQLGLGRLGEARTDLNNTRLAQVNIPPRSVVTFERGKSYSSLYIKRLLEWRGETQKVNQARALQVAQKALDIPGINQKHAQLIIDMLHIETQAVTAGKLGIPEKGIVDMAALEVSRRIAMQASRLMETENAMIWVYRHGLGGDQTKGYLGLADIQNNAQSMGETRVTYGDVVVINLADIVSSKDVKDLHQAKQEAAKVIKELSKRGVTIALQSSSVATSLRLGVVEELQAGGLGYRPMEGSHMFFVPITEEADSNAAQRAYASTLLETQQIYTKNVAIGIVSDDIATGLTEATQMIDTEHDRAYNTVSHTLLPYMMTSSGSVGRRNPFAFGVPQRGEGRADQLSKVNSQLLELMNTTEGMDYLRELLGPENSYPKYQVNANGTIEHGVLTIDDALAQLKKVAEGGGWPLDVNQKFFWGTIVPFVSGDGSIHLQRVGFKPPSERTMNKQRKLRFEDKQLKFTASAPKLDDNQTLPPPTTVERIRFDDKGLSVTGTYEPGDMAKMIAEGVGLKAGLAWMPKGFKFPDAVINAVGAAGMRLTRIMGTTSVVGKEGHRKGLVNNFRDGFAVTGINFQDDMIDFLFGENPNRTPQDRSDLWELAENMLNEWAAQPPRFTGVELSRILDDQSTMILMESQFNAIASSVSPTMFRPISLRTDVSNPQTANQRLGTVFLAALSAKGVELNHLIETPGLTTVKDHNSGSLVRFMPALFTDALNDPAHPELRQLLIARMNRNMPTDPTDPSKHLYWFDNEMKLHALMNQEYDDNGVTKVRQEEIVGWMHITVPIPADENALRLTYAGVSSKGAESKHVADVTAEATGGRVATKTRSKRLKDLPTQLEEIRGKNEIARFEDPETAPAELYYTLTRLREGGEAYHQWGMRTPMEEDALEDQRNKMVQYIHRGVRSPETGWSPEQSITADRLATDFLKKLKITDPKAIAEVEYLIRQLYAIPGPASGQDDYSERLSFEVFQSGIEALTRNVDKGMHPLEGGFVPMEHETFWKMVFDAQQGRPKSDQWLPLASGNKKGKSVTSDNWGEWVNALMGQVRASDKAINSRFRPDLDGFYNTYQGTHPDYANMAITTDQQKMAKLLDPETNRPYVSMDPGRDAVLADPIVLASKYMTYDALVGKGVVTVELEAEEASGSVVAKRIASVEAWQRTQELPKQKDLSVKEYVQQGATYQESMSQTNNLMRNMVNLSLAVRLFNPALYFSAMLEVPFRSALEGATNILTGQTTGQRGRAAAGLGSWLEEGLNKGDDQWWLSARLGIDNVAVSPRYSVAEIETINQLNEILGDSNRFKGMVYAELAYQTVIAGGRGKIGERLEKAAAAAARATADPRMGMSAKSLAKRYNDAVLQHLAMTNSQITVAQYAHMMKEDPTWIETEAPEAHQMGLNAVQQARGAKPTWIGNGIMKPITHMTSSENGFVNGAGHLVKLPFLFTRFNANMFVTLTGLSGMDQAAAMFFGGREKPQIIRRMLTRSKANENTELSPEYWDNTDIIEAIDLSRSFVRGAVTQTGLMAMAMMAGGFSLGGEDEEERRRARMATYLGTPYYHDPRKASNDWRWKDAIFLDNVPILSNILTANETGHTAVVPHWIFRQFLSPVLGMMRFFETGNFDEVIHGYVDAVSVLPNSVLRLGEDAAMTAQLLAETAKDDELVAEKQDSVASLLTNIVFVYEKAMFENAFINSLYQARDEFDRNPWAIPLTEEGNSNVLVREQGSGQPVPTTALQAYQLEAEKTSDGLPSNRVGYMTRSGTDALMHQYSEGNATAAVMLSILPWLQGQDSTYLRGNMVTKRQKVQVDPTSADEVEALVFSTYLGRGGQDAFTMEEIIGAIKQREQAADRFWDQSAVEAEAEEHYAALKENPLTIFSDGAEKMTLEGKEGVFRSLRDGVVDLDTPAIAGFNVSQDERDAIAERLTTALVQEGVDVGMSDQAAMYRMRRIWFGDATNPGVPGLREILYDKRIPDKPYVEYDQLNVTYVTGPDGKPWATPFSKMNVMQAMGIPLPHMMERPKPGMGLDARGNSTDLVRGINTGQAALAPRPVAVDIEANDDAVEKAQAKSYSPGGNAGGYRRYGGGYGRSGGYSSGGGYGPGFQRMWNLPGGTSARMDDPQTINVSNPQIRRSNVRRERISSQRGRLKQWQ